MIQGQNRSVDGDTQARVREIMTGYVGHKGALLMALLDVQYQLNYIPETTVDDAAEILGYSKPEVWGVLSFYSDFTVGTTAEHIVDVCIDTPCHVAGARRIWSVLEAGNADGARFLSFLAPLFISVMMDNLDKDWGVPSYPPLTESD